MTKTKKILSGFAALFVVAGGYFAAVEAFVWKWESPHDPLPAGIYELVDADTAPEGQADIVAAMQGELTALAKELNTVSLSFAVNAGEVKWASAIGLGHVNPIKPATRDTQYRVGSVSKPLTSLGLMKLMEKGKISLDDPVSKYLPDYAHADAGMTVRQVASHTAGVRHYHLDFTNFPPTDAYSDVYYDSVAGAMATFESDALLFAPGTDFNYSTHGYTLLSAVMEAAAGMPFLDFMQEAVFTPLGMASTGPDLNQQQLPNRAGFYTSDGGLYGETPYVDLSVKWAGGGFLSTASDLATAGQQILAGDFLSEATFDTMIMPVPLASGDRNPQYYAIGWRHHPTQRIFDETRKINVVHHGGVSTGSISFWMLVPDHDISIAIMSNGAGDKTRGAIQMFAYRISKLLIEHKEAAQ